MSDLKTTWITSWTQLKRWSGTDGLPVLPPPGALIELGVLMAMIVIIDAAFPSLGFSSLEPSPFWLPVLLLSLQYGTIAGLMAAAAATAIYVFNGVAEQAVGENFFTYLLRIWALPILWIGVALVLGQFRLRQIAEKQRVRQALIQRTGEAQHLAAYASDLEARCQRLERQLTTRLAAPVKPVLDALAPMAEPSISVDGALETITRMLWPGAQVSVFAVTPNGLDVASRSGWGDTAPWATGIAAAHPLYRAVVGDRRTVSMLNTGDEAVLAGHGLAAHPVLTPDGNRVTAMLKIEMMDPAFLDRATPAHLALISRLLAVVLSEPVVRVEVPPAGARMSRGWKSEGAIQSSNENAPHTAKAGSRKPLRGAGAD
ncbi:MAG: hypothetical protein ABL893_09190 [Hyphomicrobium sp.]|nr:hypothetical protein [Hyphomicrobium sp.]